MTFNPIESFSKAFEAWQSVTEMSVQRTVSLYEGLMKLESKGSERAFAAIEELGKLTRSNLAYQRELGEELRKLAAETWTKNASAS